MLLDYVNNILNMWNKILCKEVCTYIIEMGQETKVSAMKSTLLITET